MSYETKKKIAIESTGTDLSRYLSSNTKRTLPEELFRERVEIHEYYETQIPNPALDILVLGICLSTQHI